MLFRYVLETHVVRAVSRHLKCHLLSFPVKQLRYNATKRRTGILNLFFFFFENKDFMRSSEN